MHTSPTPYDGSLAPGHEYTHLQMGTQSPGRQSKVCEALYRLYSLRPLSSLSLLLVFVGWGWGSQNQHPLEFSIGTCF